MVQAYPRILYISCNPETLCRNLETLSQTHNVTRLALFDQFPYTHHMECGVLLTRNRPKTGNVILPVFTAGGLLGCGIFAVTHLVADPEDHRDGQNGREEVRTDIRVLRTHDGAVQQHPENKKAAAVPGSPTGILRF